MKIPLNWLRKYIDLEHTPEEFGEIMTNLEFMQDGVIKDNVIDLEVRQNRPDILSIIGVAREYSAYINKPVNYPELLKNLEIEWGIQSKNLKVFSNDIVKRFCTVEIKNIKIKKSPQWMIDDLKSYGIPSINNVVDITNYIMIEYGIPLHAFDKKKLKANEEFAYLNLRRAIDEEEFETWQGSKISLTKDDLVVADSEKVVAIAGIIGGANSDIDNTTNNIILECATYDQSYIRRSSIRHSIRTEASTRHEKFLNPESVEISIRRALKLITELTDGEIISIEDFYPAKSEKIHIDFNTYEISRIGGVSISIEETSNLLKRLGFDVIDQKEAIGLEKNILTIGVPHWRTDVKGEMDLVEEVLRLWGYDKIPFRKIESAPPDFSTPLDIQLDAKICDILINLGLDEHITNPMVKKSENSENQVLIENPLNEYQDALRTSIMSTLSEVINFNRKSGQNEIAIFESGKIYLQKRQGEFTEEKQIATIYHGHNFIKIKSDLMTIFSRLGIDKKIKWDSSTQNKISYSIEGIKIAYLYTNGYELYTERFVDFVDISKVPTVKIKTSLSQRILEEISIVTNSNVQLGKISEIMKASSEYIKNIEIKDIYNDEQIGEGKKSTTFSVLFEDFENKMTRENIQSIKDSILEKIKSQFEAKLRD